MSAGCFCSAVADVFAFRFVLGFAGFGKDSPSFFLARYAFARHAPEQYLAGFPRPDGLSDAFRDLQAAPPKISSPVKGK